MFKEGHKDWLLEQVKILSEHLKEGRFDQIDLTVIEKEAADMARNFKDVIESLENAGQKMGFDSNDLPTIAQHLTHISQSTEKGVMNAISKAESIMDEALIAKESLEKINESVKGNRTLEDKLQSAGQKMDSIQDHCFSIITALEFEDINRQVMEKILARVNVLYDNLLKILLMLKIKERVEKKDTTFLDSLKHIIDIEGANRQSQEMIDDLFEDFGL